MVRVGVSAEVAHGDVFVSEGLDATAGEAASGVAIDEQCQHRGRRVLRGTGATLVDFGGGEIEGGNSIHDEINHVILADPVPEIGR